ncbi:MAG: RluA family pseudouridine synthase [Candidatus Binatus sp.]|uniref:RluA family pseudouridine synthase n=1 Tax=Candidatus Binatus sp. TaxID=2811406 RepID=UPI0027195757|nr:RluA family pseudouridine synthase [Candidatus Binatus sp.]MDO8433781.1 RluA family pseudouridine synthase [Candidatus Binatus sp.]
MDDVSRERLDHYLVRTGLASSRRIAQELVERGMVRINGRYPRKSEIVGADDQVEVRGANIARIATPLQPDSSIAIDIVHQDAAVIVVNKPGGIPCHPLRPDERGTVMNAIVARFPDTASAGEKPLEGGLVHRLDNGTSGAMLIARNRAAFIKLREAIRSSKIARRYEALVLGDLDRKLTIDTPIAHHPKNPRKMIGGDPASANPKRAGRPALTTVEPLRRIGDFTLVSIVPKTGCRHQIRVHLASAGLPIVGDTLYGGPESAQLAHGRFWLHLCDIAFDSPAVGHVKATAPLPQDLKALLA